MIITSNTKQLFKFNKYDCSQIVLRKTIFNTVNIYVVKLRLCNHNLLLRIIG